MQLKINGERIDYTLEKEAVLSEVIKGVEDWLGGSGLLVTGIRMGERELFSFPKAEWAATPIASVAELDFKVNRTDDVRIQHWTTVRAWLGLLGDEMEAGGSSLDDLLDGFASTLVGIKQNPFLPSGSDAVDRLASLLAGQTSAEVRSWPPEKKLEAASLMTGMRDVLSRRIDEASHPHETLKSRIGELRAVIGPLTEVPVLLQTGKDKQAMETIVGFSDLVQKLIDLIPFLPKDSDREKLFTELNPVLRQLLSAFDAKDFVLIGDLFEYEVAPRLQKLLPLLDRSL